MMLRPAAAGCDLPRNTTAPLQPQLRCCPLTHVYLHSIVSAGSQAPCRCAQQQQQPTEEEAGGGCCAGPQRPAAGPTSSSSSRHGRQRGDGYSSSERLSVVGCGRGCYDFAGMQVWHVLCVSKAACCCAVVTRLLLPSSCVFAAVDVWRLCCC